MASPRHRKSERPGAKGPITVVLLGGSLALGLGVSASQVQSVKWLQRDQAQDDVTSAHRDAVKAARNSNVLERVRKIVIEHLDADPQKVTEMANFIDDLGADCLDTVELVMAFEEEFHIEIPDDAAEHIHTVGDAVRYIDAHLVAPAGSE